MFDVLELDLTLEQAYNIPRCLLLTTVLQCKRAVSSSYEEDTAMDVRPYFQETNRLQIHNKNKNK